METLFKTDTHIKTKLQDTVDKWIALDKKLG